MHPILTVAAIILPLGLIEATAHWWMNPSTEGSQNPVLTYTPTPTTEDTDFPKITPLPEIVARSIPSLRCSSGTALRIEREDWVTIHAAFFRWDRVGSTNVLESFKHLPEQCMGSIGAALTNHDPLRSYQLGNETLWFDHTVFRDQSGAPVHAFKCTWVSGSSSLLDENFRGGGDQWNQLRGDPPSIVSIPTMPG